MKIESLWKVSYETYNGLSVGDSFIRLTTGYRRSDVVRFARKHWTSSWFIYKYFISGVTIRIFPLIYFTEEITHGRIHQRQNGHLLDTR